MLRKSEKKRIYFIIYGILNFGQNELVCNRDFFVLKTMYPYIMSLFKFKLFKLKYII